ncbi:ATP-binding protein [Streptomyces coeruleoprunus]|uniref:ATP-binding protein n=1 Tax=Streptomyces coeruleoprunus TaxID=285563 RepID=A0ABV9X6L6_9ACTN
MNHVTDPAPGEIGDCYRMAFTLGEHSVRHLRRVLRMLLASWGMTGVAEAAELALTELATNVVRHVPGRWAGTIILRGQGVLRVEVSDRDERPALPARPYDGLSEGGRGLLLVEAVTDRWGVTRLPDGKTVWFECDDKAETGPPTM